MKGKKKLPKQKIRKEWRVKVKSPPWTELPPEITANILCRLGVVGILDVAQNVCTTWRRVCQDPSMWRVIDMSYTGDLFYMPADPEKICRLAVDRSQGQLVDINIEYFGTDDLLLYVAERSPQLRRLRLVSCYNVSDDGLSKAVSSFPFLEELHIFMSSINKEAIKAVGHSCPMLKTFTLNEKGYKVPHIECDERAMAVAQSMPGLRHLRLFGGKMTNEGLQAILDNCSHLESLDLRQCFNIKLESELGKRCSQQIKFLKRPNDSTEGYEFDAEICSWYSYDFPSGDSDIMNYYDLDYDAYDYDDLDYDDFTRLPYYGSDSDYELWFPD